MGLALFHAFSKVMIVLGLEPEPGSMAVTELATPDTDRPATSLEAGLENLGAACAAEVGAHGDLLDLARLRIGQVLGVLDGSRPPSPGREAFLDLVELFVIDVHAVTDELFAAAVDGLDPAVVVSLLIGLAHGDAVSRIERCAVRQVDMTR